MNMKHRKSIYIVLLFFIIVSPQLFSQMYTTAVMLPWISTQDYLVLATAQIKDTTSVDALYAEAWYASIHNPFVFSYIKTKVSNTNLRAFFLGVPECMSPDVIPSFTIPAFSVDFHLSAIPLNPGLVFFQGFVPTIETEIEQQHISLHSKPIWGIGGNVAIRDISVFSFLGLGQGELHIQSVPLGNYEVIATGAGLSFKSFSFFYSYVYGNANVNAQAMVTNDLGVSINASGNLMAHLFGTIGKFEYKFSLFDVVVPYIAGFVWAEKQENNFYYTYKNSISSNKEAYLNLLLSCNPAVLVLSKPEIIWSISRNWKLALGRLLVFQNGWNLLHAESASPYVRSESTFDIVTMLFAGMTLTVVYQK